MRPTDFTPPPLPYTHTHSLTLTLRGAGGGGRFHPHTTFRSPPPNRPSPIGRPAVRYGVVFHTLSLSLSLYIYIYMR